MAEDTSEFESSSSKDASGQSDSDREEPSSTAHSKDGENHEDQRRTGEDDTTSQGPVSQPRRLFDEPDEMDEASEGQSSQGQPRSRQSSSRKASKSKRNKSESSKPRQKVDARVSRAYHDLLNSAIKAANGQVSEVDYSLESSQTGASAWTSEEKDIFFNVLARRGLEDLPSLCRAITTKSEYEIRAYLGLLKEGATGRQGPTLNKGCLSFCDVPAAVEVSKDCETVLDAVADHLESLATEHDSLLEYQKFGDEWLVDAGSAEREELAYEEQRDVASNDIEDAHEAESIVPESQSAQNTAKSTQDSLLRPALLLHLSRTLFMNNSEHEYLNWRQIASTSTETDEPAMYKSAYDDLQNITINLTRRLVQASIFQAMTRLRAGDASRKDWTPVAAVREVDVRSALDLLDLEPKWHQYWAGINRRCQVTACSESKKYNDGRPGTKAGYALSYNEAEVELGNEKIDEDEVEVEPISDADADDLMQDDELFTDDEPVEEQPALGIGGAESGGEDRPSGNRTKKHKRALSPGSFFHAEERYLEAFDQQKMADDEITLRRMLRLPARDASGVPRGLQRHSPGARPSDEDGTTAWRDHVQYEADWEHQLGVPTESEFRIMGLRGQVGRKRRKILEQNVRERLASGILPGGGREDVDGYDEEEEEEDSMSLDETDNEGLPSVAGESSGGTEEQADAESEDGSDVQKSHGGHEEHEIDDEESDDGE